MEEIFRQHLGSVDDPDMISYLEAIVDGYIVENETCDAQGFHQVLSPILEDIGLDSAAIDSLCVALGDLIKPKETARIKIDTEIELKDLQHEASQLMAHVAPRGAKDVSMVQKGTNANSIVDAKKLIKAEEKLKKKQEKRKLENGETIEEPAKAMEYENVTTEMLFEKISGEGTSKVRDIHLEHVDVDIGGKKLLTDASVTLVYGRRYGLVGRNGVGKSSFLRALSSRQIAIPPHVSILHVEQEVVGDDTLAIRSVLEADSFREYAVRREAELTELLNQGTKEKLANELAIIHKFLQDTEADKAESRASVILSGLGFTAEMQTQPTKSFSGGWRMRLSLAQALFMRPDLLLLDEPTNMLDLPAVVWLETYLLTWPHTVLVVSHDRSFLDHVGTDILHLHHARLDNYRGDYSYFLATKEERLKHQQKEYEAQQTYRQHLQAFIDRFRYNAKRASQAQSKLKILEKLPILVPISKDPPIVFSFPNPQVFQGPMVQMHGISFSYGSRMILSNVLFSLDRKTRVAIVGKNGSGKTTFLKLLIGQLSPSSGEFHRNSRARLGMFSQHHMDQLDLSKSPLQTIQSLKSDWPEEECRRFIGRFGLSGSLALQRVGTLSGGQKSRLVFCTIAVTNPHALILDEPTNHLDMDSIDALIDALKSYDGAVVVVSHDQRFVDHLCEYVLVCDNGTIKRLNGTMKDYRNSISQEMIKAAVTRK